MVGHHQKVGHSFKTQIERHRNADGPQVSTLPAFNDRKNVESDIEQVDSVVRQIVIVAGAMAVDVHRWDWLDEAAKDRKRKAGNKRDPSPQVKAGKNSDFQRDG